ncbi:GNAT family N-acetyltransferase [Halegenticoccus soli]|uniref:GNAT family N-acetyltransferase n=1 Tax=Halegenticoccus soli TaxID=1985678 RepID=UPI000C6D6C67|nr:GNAT family N-acetyltransferase [Halegenticoccus soli]
MTVRRARPEDYDAVAAFTTDTWPDRGGDYIPRIYHEWIEGDDDGQMTFVLDAGDGAGGTPSTNVAGICQGVLLSEYEAWGQGMRVHPEYRGRGVALALTDALFEWAAGAGATVVRNMVFSWNVAGLGQSRAAGFDPCTEFRWATPTPDADAEPDLRVTGDPDGGWAFWTASDARAHLKGLALDGAESWALSELTRDRLREAADEGRLFTVQDGGTRALSLRNRSYERENEAGASETWAEYAVGAWADAEAARALYRAIERDAADAGADRTRVLVPESVRWVSDTAAARAAVSDEPDFVMAADLTDEPDDSADETARGR